MCDELSDVEGRMPSLPGTPTKPVPNRFLSWKAVMDIISDCSRPVPGRRITFPQYRNEECIEKDNSSNADSWAAAAESLVLPLWTTGLYYPVDRS